MSSESTTNDPPPYIFLLYERLFCDVYTLEEDDLHQICNRLETDFLIKSNDDIPVMRMLLTVANNVSYEDKFIVDTPRSRLQLRQNEEVELFKFGRFVSELNMQDTIILYRAMCNIQDFKKSTDATLLLAEHYKRNMPHHDINDMYSYNVQLPRCTIV